MRKISVFPVLLVVVFASCRKTPEETFKGCLITQIKAAGVLPQRTSLDVYRMEYSDKGALVTVEATSTTNGIRSESVKHFSYGANYIVVDHYKANPGVPDYRDSFVVNSEKRIVAMYTTLNNMPMTQVHTVTYDGEGQLKDMGGGLAWEWANGDVVVQHAGNENVTYTYSDTAYNVGAIKASYEDLINYGGPLVKKTRLTKTAQYAQLVYDYTYQLDKEGKIEKWYARSRDGQYDWTYEYAYDCK